MQLPAAHTEDFNGFTRETVLPILSRDSGTTLDNKTMDEEFIDHIKEEAKKKKIKKPWLGALLAFILGPLGFLYYSWKAAIGWFVALFLGVVLLNFIFPNLQLPRWLKYIVLMIMAIYAYMDIRWWNSAITHWKNNK